AALVDVLEWVPVRLELRRGGEELVEAHADVRMCFIVPVLVLDGEDALIRHRLHEDARVPFAVRIDADAEREPMVVDVGRLRAADARLAHEVVATVTEDERVLLEACVALTPLLERVLDLEEVR